MGVSLNRTHSRFLIDLPTQEVPLGSVRCGIRIAAGAVLGEEASQFHGHPSGVPTVVRDSVART